MEAQNFEIVISDAALSMLESHVDFLARVSKAAALKLMDEILTSIESLHKNPQRYPLYTNQFISECRYHKMICAKRYMIIYEIADGNVFVDYIVDCRQDYEWMLH